MPNLPRKVHLWSWGRVELCACDILSEALRGIRGFPSMPPSNERDQPCGGPQRFQDNQNVSTHEKGKLEFISVPDLKNDHIMFCVIEVC